MRIMLLDCMSDILLSAIVCNDGRFKIYFTIRFVPRKLNVTSKIDKHVFI